MHIDSTLAAELAAAVACDDALLRKRTVCALAGVGEAYIDGLVKRNAFVVPIRMSRRCVRFRSGDVKRWLAAQAEGIATHK